MFIAQKKYKFVWIFAGNYIYSDCKIINEPYFTRCKKRSWDIDIWYSKDSILINSVFIKHLQEKYRNIEISQHWLRPSRLIIWRKVENILSLSSWSQKLKSREFLKLVWLWCHKYWWRYWCASKPWCIY